nr:Fe(3+)-hydroxamate ABC transporter permease FhuB [Rhizobium lusitanum]
MVGKVKSNRAALALIALAVLLSVSTVCRMARMLSASASGDTTFAVLAIEFQFLPRMAVCLLAGAALGQAGLVMQRVLRNPLAEPTTIGVSAGAQLAIMSASLFAPSLLLSGKEWLAIAGGLAATGLAFAAASAARFSPLALLLSGLVVGLLCNSVAGILMLFRWQYLGDFFFWSSGSLAQNDWSAISYLLPRVLGCTAALLLLLRPLSAMSLGDDAVRALGLSARSVRLTALAIAVLLSAFVVAAAGMLGFVGLAAPAIARMIGARTFRRQLAMSSVVGGLLLWSADEAVQWAGSLWPGMPTGVATALLGAPLLLLLLRRIPHGPASPDSSLYAYRRTRNPAFVLTGLTIFSIVLLWLALDFGKTADGWVFAHWDDFMSLATWRWPRVLASFFAGGMIALAGSMIQKTTGNTMASPEILGISSGAVLGVLAMYMFFAAPSRSAQIVGSSIGAFLTFVILALLERRRSSSNGGLLLTGIGIGTVFGALVSLLLASGDPRMGVLLPLMTGSTYQVTASQSEAIALLGITGFILSLGCSRWLTIFSLGEPTGLSLGMNLVNVRILLLLLISVLTAAATTVIGPISFVGLTAPHLASLLGCKGTKSELAVSALVGAVVMVAADWLGRSLAFPYQSPAGLLASVVGVGFFLLAAPALKARR